MNEEEDPNDNEETEGKDNDTIDFETEYFWGKELRQDEKYNESLQVFNKIINSESDNSTDMEYKFKSIKQSIKICFELNSINDFMKYLDLFFDNLKNVNQQYGELSLSKILYRFDQNLKLNSSTSIEEDIFNKFYDKFMNYIGDDIVKNSISERLYIRLNLSKSNILLNNDKFEESSIILKELELILMNEKTSESIKNTFLLDVLAFEMIISTKYQFNLLELKRLTTLANCSISGIPQSKIIGIIKESTGLISMYEEDFKIANVYFQDSFKNFNECGDFQRIEVLIKFIISNLLSESEIDPFKSSDFNGFSIGFENISKLMKLYQFVQNVDILNYNELIYNDFQFQKLVKSNYFISYFLPFVTELIQIKYILKYLKLFKRVKFDKLSVKLNITNSQLEDLLLKLVNLGKVDNIKLDLNKGIIENSDDDGDIFKEDELTSF
ncbi:hypothetical protein CANARDRAFT_198196, partial [[Candida] arabinofermentans NRRL YB-2248]